MNTHDTCSQAHTGSSHLLHAFCGRPWDSLMRRCFRTKRELGIIYLFLLHFGQQKLWAFFFFQDLSKWQQYEKALGLGAEFHWLSPLLVWTVCFWTFHKHSIAASGSAGCLASFAKCRKFLLPSPFLKCDCGCP